MKVRELATHTAHSDVADQIRTVGILSGGRTANNMMHHCFLAVFIRRWEVRFPVDANCASWHSRPAHWHKIDAYVAAN